MVAEVKVLEHVDYVVASIFVLSAERVQNPHLHQGLMVESRESFVNFTFLLVVQNVKQLDKLINFNN